MYGYGPRMGPLFRVQPQSDGNQLSGFTAAPSRILIESATVRGRAWYKFLDAPVLNLGVTA